MSGVQTDRRGRKHRCAACGAAFYDLDRDLSACPKCATPYAAAHMPRGEPARKRSWSKSARRPEPEAVPEAPAAEATEADDDGVPVLDAAEEAEDADEAETGDEANEAAEDADK